MDHKTPPKQVFRSSEPHFVSDNASSVHADVFAAMAEANRGHAVAYGHDAWTDRAIALFGRHFGPRAEVLLALTGTGANVLALQSVLGSFEAIVCADCSHLHRDECGAPEKFIGGKVLPVPTREGKLTAATVAPLLADNDMVHRAQPRVLSVSQCTEWGTVYSIDEMTGLADFCHSNGLLLHVDGARLGNAAVALDASLHDVTTACGVDIVSFGGTKNGLMGAEAVVFLEPRLARSAAYYRKQAMQLSSKMRFVAAQFVALLEGDLWRRNAAHANAMAARLADAVKDVDAVRPVMPVETNVLFVELPPAVLERLQSSAVFAVWDSSRSIARWMTSFDTTGEQVDDFARLIRDVARHGG